MRKIYAFPLTGILVLSISLILCPAFVTSSHAREKTIIIDESNPPKARRIKPSRNTRVISIRNTVAVSKEPATNGDICPALGGYYCKSVGREAWLNEGDLYLGRISGVAWRDRGEPMGLYLGVAEKKTTEESPTESPKERPIQELLRKNTLSMSDSFYFIIDVEGLEGPVLVEPHRISTTE